MERLLFVLNESPSWLGSLSSGWVFPCRRPLDHRTARFSLTRQIGYGSECFNIFLSHMAYRLNGSENEAFTGCKGVSILDKLARSASESGNVSSPRRKIRRARCQSLIRARMLAARR